MIPPDDDVADSHFLAYIAGFFNGEGSIGIYRNGTPHGGRTLRVQLTQTVTTRSTDLLRECRARWHGSLSPYNKQSRRPAWNWQASASNAATFLIDVRPWLLLKSEQADVALAWWTSRPPRLRDERGRHLPTTDEAAALAQAAETALKALKVC